MKRVLIVDDNDRYAQNLRIYFDSKKIISDRAIDAKEGWLFFQRNKYDMVISDITMETQTSGLWMMRRIYLTGYTGSLVIASTGFDVWGVMKLSKIFLPWFCGLQWMIPKVPLKKGEIVWVGTSLSKERSSPF